MSKITQLNDKAWCAEVPDWSKDWYITNIHADNDLVCPSKYEGVHWIGMLPPGSYSILGKGDELTGGEMLSVIEKGNDGSGHLNSWWYKDYETGEGTKDFRASFRSLLKSKGLNPETTLILIKQ